MSRYLVAVLFLCCCGAAAAQSTSDLTAKYGSPDVERYEVADGITVTVLYGKDRQACQAKIEARKDSILGEAPHKEDPFISSELAARLLDELVPPAERKGTPRQMASQMGCASMSSAEYENVLITRGMNDCGPQNANVSSITVQWTRLACAVK